MKKTKRLMSTIAKSKSIIKKQMKIRAQSARAYLLEVIFPVPMNFSKIDNWHI